MKKVNLQEIIEHHCYITGDAQEGEDESVHCSINAVKDAIEQACAEIINIARLECGLSVMEIPKLLNQIER